MCVSVFDSFVINKNLTFSNFLISKHGRGIQRECSSNTKGTYTLKHTSKYQNNKDIVQVIRDSKERLRLLQKKRGTDSKEMSRTSLERDASNRRDRHKLYNVKDGSTLLRDLIQGKMYKEANDLMNMSDDFERNDTTLSGLQGFIIERRNLNESN